VFILHLKGNHSSTQIKATLDGFHCISLLYTAPVVCTQNWRATKQNFYNLISETSFWSMDEKAAFHLSLFTPQEHDIEWCIPKRGNDLKEVKGSFSLSYWMIMVIICCIISYDLTLSSKNELWKCTVLPDIEDMCIVLLLFMLKSVTFSWCGTPRCLEQDQQ